jgi:hypothetical protein
MLHRQAGFAVLAVLIRVTNPRGAIAGTWNTQCHRRVGRDGGTQGGWRDHEDPFHAVLKQDGAAL